MRHLQLTRPLVAFDLETTGLDIQNDRIVEIACVKIHPDGLREIKTKRLNPTIPISASATTIHGIRNEDVENEATFAQIAPALADFLHGCDLTGFNLEKFDLPLLKKEFERVGIPFPQENTQIIDSYKIFQTREPRDLSAAYRFYCNKKLEHAHSAEEDAKAAADVLLAQIERYEDLPCTLTELSSHCKKGEAHWFDSDGKIIWVGEEVALGFGKHKQRTLREMAINEPDYLRWILKSEFSDTVKVLISQVLGGSFPKKI